MGSIKASYWDPYKWGQLRIDMDKKGSTWDPLKKDQYRIHSNKKGSTWDPYKWKWSLRDDYPRNKKQNVVPLLGDQCWEDMIIKWPTLTWNSNKLAWIT